MQFSVIAKTTVWEVLNRSKEEISSEMELTINWSGTVQQIL